MIQDTHRRWMKVAFKLLGGERSAVSSLPRKDNGSRFRLRANLLTEAEGELFHSLQKALSGIAVICPKTRVTDVLSVVDGVRDIDEAARIDRKTIDFLICDCHSFEPRVAVQVDQWNESKNKYEVRDTCVERALLAAKLTIVHVRSDRIPSMNQLRAKLSKLVVKPGADTALAGQRKSDRMPRAPR